MYKWEDLPNAFERLETYKPKKPHYRLCVNVGDWARA